MVVMGLSGFIFGSLMYYAEIIGSIAQGTENPLISSMPVGKCMRWKGVIESRYLCLLFRFVGNLTLKVT